MPRRGHGLDAQPGQVDVAAVLQQVATRAGHLLRRGVQSGPEVLGPGHGGLGVVDVVVGDQHGGGPGVPLAQHALDRGEVAGVGRTRVHDRRHARTGRVEHVGVGAVQRHRRGVVREHARGDLVESRHGGHRPERRQAPASAGVGRGVGRQVHHHRAVHLDAAGTPGKGVVPGRSLLGTRAQSRACSRLLKAREERRPCHGQRTQICPPPRPQAPTRWESPGASAAPGRAHGAHQGRRAAAPRPAPCPSWGDWTHEKAFWRRKSGGPGLPAGPPLTSPARTAPAPSPKRRSYNRNRPLATLQAPYSTRASNARTCATTEH